MKHSILIVILLLSTIKASASKELDRLIANAEAVFIVENTIREDSITASGDCPVIRILKGKIKTDTVKLTKGFSSFKQQILFIRGLEGGIPSESQYHISKCGKFVMYIEVTEPNAEIRTEKIPLTKIEKLIKGRSKMKQPKPSQESNRQAKPNQETPSK